MNHWLTVISCSGISRSDYEIYSRSGWDISRSGDRLFSVRRWTVREVNASDNFTSLHTTRSSRDVMGANRGQGGRDREWKGGLENLPHPPPPPGRHGLSLSLRRSSLAPLLYSTFRGLYLLSLWLRLRGSSRTSSEWPCRQLRVIPGSRCCRCHPLPHWCPQLLFPGRARVSWLDWPVWGVAVAQGPSLI